MESTAHASQFESQLFHSVFDASAIGVVVENMEGQPLYVNPAFCAFLGFSEEELRSKHCVQFSPPEDAARDWAYFRQLRAGEIDHYQLEKRYVRRDGSLVWGSLSISLTGGPFSLVLALVEDITAKKRAEEALFRHTAIIESSEDAIASVNLDGAITSWNPGAQRMFGYSESDIVGKSVSILVPPELADEESRILETLTSGGRIEQLETVRITKAGKRINVSLNISPIKDSTGQTVGFSGISRDITERKRAEEVLHESEERLRLAVQAGRMFAYSWDAATDVIERSGEWAGILGVEKDQARTGAAASVLVHPDDKQRLENSLSSLTPENPTLHITYRIIRPDRSIAWLDRNSHAYFDPQGRLKRIVGMVADVTERMRAENRLREYERAVEGSEEMIAVVDREYRYLIANRKFVRMRNMAREQVIGHFAGDVLNPGVFESVVKPKLDECFEGKVVRYEMKYTYPSCGERDLFVSYFPIEGTNGVDRAACILRDITDRKQAEEALAGMTRKLIEAQEQERARIGRELHDDINQRLALLAIEVEQLRDDRSDLPNRLVELRNEVVQISNDVQSLSHQLHSSKLEYLGVVAGMKSWCREFAERHRVDVDFKADVSDIIPPDVGLALLRVLQEAAWNSVKHGRANRIEVQLWNDPSEVHLRIRDLGKGFEVNAALEGKGLGLVSMRERVRLLNGNISIDSQPSEGTTIHARVPLLTEHSTSRVAI